jgi:hypothetical protein
MLNCQPGDLAQDGRSDHWTWMLCRQVADVAIQNPTYLDYEGVHMSPTFPYWRGELMGRRSQDFTPPQPPTSGLYASDEQPPTWYVPSTHSIIQLTSQGQPKPRRRESSS